MIDVKAMRKKAVTQVEVFGETLPFLFSIGAIMQYARLKRLNLQALFADLQTGGGHMVSLFFHLHQLGCEAMGEPCPFELEEEFEVLLGADDLSALSEALAQSMPAVAEKSEGNDKAAD